MLDWLCFCFNATKLRNDECLVKDFYERVGELKYDAIVLHILLFVDCLEDCLIRTLTMPATPKSPLVFVVFFHDWKKAVLEKLASLQ